MVANRVFVASGHGGDDPGAVVAGLLERDLNAAVARRLTARLAAHGIDVVCDLDHGNPRFPAEAELARSVGGVAFYLAVHHNHFHTEEPRGAEAFGSAGAGLDLAASLHHAQIDALRILDPTLPDRGAKDAAGTGAAKHAEAAPGAVAVLEPCFMSSPADRAVCTHPDYVDLLAEAWCRALVDHGRVDGAWDVSFQADGPALPALFSVVVPTCDRPDLLPHAVRSVLAQTVTGLEVLVVDDGREPAVVEVDDPRVRVLRPGGGRGPAAARNSALEAALGRYVAFLDDDDLWTPDRLDLALRGLRRAPVAICGTQHLGGPPPTSRVLEGHVGDVLLDHTTPCLGATALERGVAPRFDERWHGVEDVVWWWTLAQASPVATEDDVGYLVRLHEGARGRNPVGVRVDENLRLLSENRRFFRDNRTAAAHRWRRVSLLARAEGRHLTAARAALMYVVVARRLPGRIRRPLARTTRRVRRERRS